MFVCVRERGRDIHRHTWTEREIETDRQKDRQTDRQTDKRERGYGGSSRNRANCQTHVRSVCGPINHSIHLLRL